MAWARKFACHDSSSTVRQEQFFKLNSKEVAVDQLIDELRQIIAEYNERFNPSLNDEENKAIHYIKRLSSCSEQKFFCGKKGQHRSVEFTKILDKKHNSSTQKLKEISEYAFSEYKAAWFNSLLAKNILITIGNYVDLLKRKKNYTGTGFLRRIHDTVMAIDEKEVEMVSCREDKLKI